MVACTHEELPQPPNCRSGDAGEHPIIAIVAVISIIAAILLITWARFEVHGTRDIEAAFTEGGPIVPQPDDQREIDAAVTSNRFASGVTPQ
jgi:hypothetical protein